MYLIGHDTQQGQKQLGLIKANPKYNNNYDPIFH